MGVAVSLFQVCLLQKNLMLPLSLYKTLQAFCRRHGHGDTLHIMCLTIYFTELEQCFFHYPCVLLKFCNTA